MKKLCGIEIYIDNIQDKYSEGTLLIDNKAIGGDITFNVQKINFRTYISIWFYILLGIIIISIEVLGLIKFKDD